MTLAYVSGGSNLEPEQHLLLAARELKAGYPGARFSRVYRNRAIGFDGPDFLNFVAELPVQGEPGALKAELERIEGAVRPAALRAQVGAAHHGSGHPAVRAAWCSTLPGLGAAATAAHSTGPSCWGHWPSWRRMPSHPTAGQHRRRSCGGPSTRPAIRWKPVPLDLQRGLTPSARRDRRPIGWLAKLNPRIEQVSPAGATSTTNQGAGEFQVTEALPNGADTAWLLTATALVLFMTPAGPGALL